LHKRCIGITFEKGRMFSIIESLSAKNKTPLSEMAAPVGPAIKQLTHFKNTPVEATVDEPLAEVFKARERLVVGDQTTYRARLLAVDLPAETCKVEIGGSEKIIRGKIIDPVIMNTPNIYTHALDTGDYITIVVKPVIREQEIATLYTSNAVGDLP
jgi:hypothetical protein